PLGGDGAQVARRLVGRGEPALVDARPIDDPIRVETVRLVQVLVGDDPLGGISTGPQDLHAHQGAGRGIDVEYLSIAHRRPAPVSDRVVRAPAGFTPGPSSREEGRDAFQSPTDVRQRGWDVHGPSGRTRSTMGPPRREIGARFLGRNTFRGLRLYS